MAKIKLGAIVVDIRGKLNGHVFAKNRGGAYMRGKVTPVNPQTTSQTSVRQLFGAISQQWSGLAQSVRDGWNSAVSEWQKTDIFGDLKQPSGKALFQRLNNQAQSAGYPAVTSAPAKLEMVEGVVTSAVINDDSADMVLTGAYVGADARIVVYSTGQISEGTTFVKNKLRQIYSSVGNAFNDSQAYTAYTDKFGIADVGSNVYFAFKYVLPNGQASPLQIVKGLVDSI